MRFKYQYLIAALFLGSGASLLVYIFAGISLGLALLVSAVLLGSAWAYTWKKAGNDRKKYLRLRVRAGFVAGIIGTAAYDISRFFLIKITGIRFWPFDIFNIFGKAVLGEAAQGFWVAPVGVAFHFLNGITFAISYTILFGSRGIFYGILWALGLEMLMVTVYPQWLNIKLINEFLSVSVFGHIVYGATVGLVAKKSLIRYFNNGVKNEQ